MKKFYMGNDKVKNIWKGKRILVVKSDKICAGHFQRDKNRDAILKLIDAGFQQIYQRTLWRVIRKVSKRYSVHLCQEHDWVPAKNNAGQEADRVWKVNFCIKKL